MSDLLERHLFGKVGDDVAAVYKLAVGPVDQADLGARGDDPLEPGDVLAAHRLSSGRGFLPGSGPIQTEAGRMMRRSFSASRNWAVQPHTRDVPNKQGEKG